MQTAHHLPSHCAIPLCAVNQLLRECKGVEKDTNRKIKEESLTSKYFICEKIEIKIESFLKNTSHLFNKLTTPEVFNVLTIFNKFIEILNDFKGMPGELIRPKLRELCSQYVTNFSEKQFTSLRFAHYQVIN
jgi:hypothetical protein